MTLRNIWNNFYLSDNCPFLLKLRTFFFLQGQCTMPIGEKINTLALLFFYSQCKESLHIIRFCTQFWNILKAFEKILSTNPANIYLLKVNKRNTRKRCEICSKLTVKTPERRQWFRSGVFIVTLNMFHALC